MSRWMVNVRGQQFSAADMNELRKLAKTGALNAGDIVQPPGAGEWLYAIEVPELTSSLRKDAYLEMDAPPAPAAEMNPVLKWGLAAVLSLVAVVAWGWALSIANDTPEAADLELIGERGLKYTEVLVTADPAIVYTSDSKASAQVGQLDKNAKADLLAKRGDWYRVRAGGAEGYVGISDVIPAFFFADEATQQKYKPLYYPDQYVQIQNSSWSTVPGAAKGQELTSFLFMIGNTSMFPMTSVKIKALIKDGAGRPLEELEIPIEGTLPPHDSNFVGMLNPDPKDRSNPAPRIMLSKQYEELLAADPTLADRWVDGVEVSLQSTGFTNAEIQLTEVRAVPPDEMPSK